MSTAKGHCRMGNSCGWRCSGWKSGCWKGRCWSACSSCSSNPHAFSGLSRTSVGSRTAVGCTCGFLPLICPPCLTAVPPRSCSSTACHHSWPWRDRACHQPRYRYCPHSPPASSDNRSWSCSGSSSTMGNWYWVGKYPRDHLHHFRHNPRSSRTRRSCCWPLRNWGWVSGGRLGSGRVSGRVGWCCSWHPGWGMTACWGLCGRRAGVRGWVCVRGIIVGLWAVVFCRLSSSGLAASGSGPSAPSQPAFPSFSPSPHSPTVESDTSH